MDEVDVGGREDVERLPTAFPVLFTFDGRPEQGVAVNVSKKGLCLRTAAPVPSAATLDLTLVDPKGGQIAVRGLVRWVFELSPMLQPTYPIEAGIALEDATPEFLALFHREVDHFVDYRNESRVPHQLRVELSGPGFWETTFALNLGRRGIFVRTDQSLVIGQLVEVRMHMPTFPDPILVRGEVVHVLTPDHAMQVGAQPGVGLRFNVVPSGFRERYQAYLDGLEDRFRS